MKKIVLVMLAAVCLLTGCTSAKTEMRETTTEYSVLIDNADHQIPATVVIPAGDEVVPMVVMLHGTGSSKDEAGDAYKMLAPMLAEAGIGSIRFDFPGCGDSTADYVIYSNTEAISDVAAVMGYLAGTNVVDMDRVGILGWSQGGTDALLAASVLDEFKSVATWAGALDIGSMATEQMRKDAKEQGYAVFVFGFRPDAHLGLKWIEEADSMDVLEYASKIKAPIASIHGTLDDTVPFSDSEKVQAVAQNPKSELLPIEGTDHLYGVFSGDLTFFGQLADTTVDWFVRTL